MLKKRIIGVITVLDGLAVQSFGYKKYLPLGKPKVLAENLNNWGADEIFIQSINRSKYNMGPDVELLNSIAELSLSTPLTYAGGINSVEDALKTINTGCERIAIDNIIHQDINKINDISLTIGSQALIASIPVEMKENKLFWFDYRRNIFKENFREIEEISAKGLISEIFLIDKKNEGFKNSFDQNILNYLRVKDTSIILFGGISEFKQIRYFFSQENISSIAIGNFLNYKEHMIQIYKKELNDQNMRKCMYSKTGY